MVESSMAAGQGGNSSKDQQIKELTEELRAVKQELAVFRYEVHVSMQSMKEEIMQALKGTRSSSGFASKDPPEQPVAKTPAKDNIKVTKQASTSEITTPNKTEASPVKA